MVHAVRRMVDPMTLRKMDNEDLLYDLCPARTPAHVELLRRLELVPRCPACGAEVVPAEALCGKCAHVPAAMDLSLKERLAR